MAVNQIKFWRIFYSRRRRESTPWMDIVGGIFTRITQAEDIRITEAGDRRITE